jgi:hypothetical protein
MISSVYRPNSGGPIVGTSKNIRTAGINYIPLSYFAIRGCHSSHNISLHNSITEIISTGRVSVFYFVYGWLKIPM